MSDLFISSLVYIDILSAKVFIYEYILTGDLLYTSVMLVHPVWHVVEGHGVMTRKIYVHSGGNFGVNHTIVVFTYYYQREDICEGVLVIPHRVEELSVTN